VTEILIAGLGGFAVFTYLAIRELGAEVRRLRDIVEANVEEGRSPRANLTARKLSSD
jgi:hypothetical protein